MKKNLLSSITLFGLFFVLMLLTACTPTAPAAVPTPNTTSVVDATPIIKTPEPVSSPIIPETPKYYGKILAGENAPYLEFDVRDYEKATSEGKIILLYFYSDYSQNCKADEVKVLDAFNDMTNPNFIGFKVHFDDPVVTELETELAKTLGVKEYITKVILKDGVVKAKSASIWDRKTYVTQMALYLDK